MKGKKLWVIEAGKVGLGLLIFVQACSLQTITISESEMQNDHFYYKGSVAAYTGKCLVKYEGTDITKAIYRYKKGLPDGKFITYYRDGQMESSGFYREGKATGRWQKWHANGKPAFVIDQAGNFYQGDYILYSDAGKVLEKGRYFENRKQGDWEYFDLNGRLIQKISYQ